MWMDETSCIFAIIAQLQCNLFIGLWPMSVFFFNKFGDIKNIVNVSNKLGKINQII